MVEKISSVESLAVDLLSQTDVRVDNRNLSRKIQALKKAKYNEKQSTEKVKKVEKVKKEEKAVKTA